jgi:hypothetical protein
LAIINPTVQVLSDKELLVNEIARKIKANWLDFVNPVVKKLRGFYWETTKQRVHELVKEKELVAI